MQQLCPGKCTLYLQGVDQPTIQINFSKNANMVGPLQICASLLDLTTACSLSALETCQQC